MDTKKIGKFISENRKRKGLTQEQLGNILGVSNKTISRWENGNYMPDLSLLIPLSESLDISLNELLNGKYITEDKIMETTEKSLKNTINYSKNMLVQEKRKISIGIMIFGAFLCFAAFSILDKESSWCCIYSIIGIVVFVYGLSKELKRNRLLISSGVFVAILCGFMLMDYVGVITSHRPPIYVYMIKTSNVTTYYNPLYTVYRINKNTPNEYYIVDSTKKYTEDTVPTTVFNRPLSGIHNIKKYKNPYIGNNSNIGNLLSKLPLNEFGYVFKIDSKNLGLTINYNTTDWYNDNMYIEKSLIYNSVSIFSLIDNVQTIQYNFSGSSYTVTRRMIKESYPHFELVKENEKNFDQYLENKMNDDEFSRSIFNKIFVKKVL